MRFDFEDFYIDCDIQYGKRKKMSINIDNVGFITIKVPNKTSDEVLTNAIMKHKDWIKEKLIAIEEINKETAKMTYDDYGVFLHLGKEYPLKELIEIEGLNEEEIKESLKRFYISSAKNIINERLKIYQEKLSIKPKIVEIDESKTKWGSCDSDKKLIFNYKLSMAPIEAIDYLVVHELCHLFHMNHDRSFWRKVGSILPDYKDRQALLNRIRL